VGFDRHCSGALVGSSTGEIISVFIARQKYVGNPADAMGCSPYAKFP